MDVGADGVASGSEPARESERIIAALRAENAALREENKALRTTIGQLQERIRELERRLGQNSRNSSRPPSSDPPGTPPAPARKRSGRRPGGQPGHAGHHCALVPREQVDQIVDHWPEACPHCQAVLTPDCEVGIPVPHQVHEVEYAHRVTQHDRHRVRCAHCGTTVLAELPPEVAGSQYGAGLAALVAVFSGVFQLARREVVHLCRELFAVPISGGSVQRLCQEASAGVAQPVAALAEAIRAEPMVGIDETGWRHRGKRGWLWAVWSRIGTLYRVADTRSGRIGREMLGQQYPGRVISDRFSGHNWIPGPRHQLCWSHLQRDAQAVIERGNPATRYGKALHGAALAIHRAWRSFKAAGETPAARLAMQQTLAPVQQRLRATLEQGCRGRDRKTARLCDYLCVSWPSLWVFLTVDGVAPTNNATERDMRRAVLWRRKSLGTQSDEGAHFVARMLTVSATARRQGRSPLTYVRDALAAARQGQPAPSLLPAAPQHEVGLPEPAEPLEAPPPSSASASAPAQRPISAGHGHSLVPVGASP